MILSGSILYADDDEDDCQLFREILSELNFQGRVTIVNDGEQLMNKLAEKDFDTPTFIFLDINMPCKNGIECVEGVRANPQYLNVPLIMLTTTSNAKSIDQCFDKGASRYIVKPNSMKRQRALIQTVIQMPKLELMFPRRSNFVVV